MEDGSFLCMGDSLWGMTRWVKMFCDYGWNEQKPWSTRKNYMYA